MTNEQSQPVIEIFDAALALAPAERDAYLAAACASDESLRSQVERLLVRHEQAEAEGFLARPAQPDLDQKTLRLAGRRVGPYLLQHELGSGGMGVVYLAVRADDVYWKEVAVKLVWPALQRAGVLRRFDQERRILAQLDHPNIARLLDGGATEEGWPYLVMEYVDGLPITKYCDARKLSIPERLKLFRTVCAAVEYAHRNLIVHRDLKPGNIFVTTAGEVKLFDFGIAKLLDPETRPSDLTLSRLPLLTPEYASPEQANGDAITTASDVYSLGVVLYELLTGGRPYRLDNPSPREIARVITETEPEPPSIAAGRVVKETNLEGVEVVVRSPEGVSAARASNPDRLGRQLRGDLDNIALMALRKEPDERYPSAAQLIADIERHLAGKPVLARTPTAAYRASKFVRRHKTGVAFASFIALTLVAVAVFIVRQWRAGVAEARENYRALYAARMDRAVHEREDFNVEGIREAVESFLPQPGAEDLRGFEWYYLWRWYNRNLITLPHGEPGGGRFSEDGSMVITYGGSANRMIKVWDAETGKLMRTLKSGADGSPPMLALFEAGFVVQGVGKQAFKMQELSTGKDVTPVIDTSSAISSSIISCVGSSDYRGCQFFTAGEDGIIRGWDLATAALLCTIKTGAPVRLWGLSLKYQRLLVGVGDNRLELWDLVARRLITAFNEPMPLGAGNLDAGDGGWLYVGDGVAKRFDWLTGRELQRVEFDKSLGNRFDARGRKFFNFGASSELRIMDWLTGRQIGELKGHREWVNFITVSDDESIAATAGADRTIRLWDFHTYRQLAVIPAHEREVYDLEFSRDGRKLASGSLDGTAKIWDVASLLAPDTLEGHTDYIFSVAFSPDSRRLATASRDRTVKLWDAQMGKLLHTMTGHGHDIFNVAFSPDGQRLASASEDLTVRIWDANTGQQIAALSDFITRPRSVAFSPDGKLLAVGCDYLNVTTPDDRTIRIWDAANYRELAVLRGHKDDVVSLDFSPDGHRLASASWDKTVKLWDVATGRELATLRGHTDRVWSVRFSPDGQRLASGGTDRSVRLWDVATARELGMRKSHSNEVFSVAFSPDGRRLASASNDRTIKLWDATTGRELVTFRDHQGEVWSVAFSRDGRMMASGSWDKTARLWRAASEEEVRARIGK
jgi:WD40 repeat protein/serine/threonine protein kinase